MANKDVTQLITRLSRQEGITVRRTSKNHYRVYRDGLMIAGIPATPSDWRSLRNAKAKLRRAGCPTI
ncbi:hypothetical protein [Acidipropionibacterium acidipropionici]|uniref:hypothetical protein n=1 Tax=Acidipropionibacterium acidipropionici TaxID=1748 RepID=UPI00110A6DE8|nr:hypothetical protein [Acidipropionibacterium acidipropionici]QCV96503.1 hypothetical protein FEZ30_15715 [Acidipropionibacterium acidipropionici]